MPARAMAAGFIVARSRPSNRIVPVCGTRPEMALNNVVLPAPLRPTTETNSPSCTWIAAARSACALP